MHIHAYIHSIAGHLLHISIYIIILYTCRKKLSEITEKYNTINKWLSCTRIKYWAMENQVEEMQNKVAKYEGQWIEFQDKICETSI